MNEFNEQFAATAGKMMADDIKRGGLRALDRQRLFILDYTPAEVKQMAAGKASQRLLDTIPGRVAAATQGTTRKRVERSLASNSPLFRFFFDFQNYLQITAERSGRVLLNLPQAFERGGVKELAAASVIAAEFFAGQTIAGLGSLALGAFVFGRAIDFGDDVVDWVAAGLLESGIAGPLRTLQFVNAGDPSSEIVVKFSPKGRLFLDVIDFAREQKGFANRTGPEKIVEILRRQVPAHRAVAPVLTRTQSAYLVAIGLRDPQLDKARRRYFDWVDKNVPRVGGKAPGFNKFRREMGNVRTWIRAGNEKRAYQAVGEAFKAAIEEETGSIPEGLDKASLSLISDKVWNKVKSSLRAQRLISGPRVPDRLLPKLRKDIGEENVQLLMLEDLILDMFIDGQFVNQAGREAARERLRKAG